MASVAEVDTIDLEMGGEAVGLGTGRDTSQGQVE